MQLVLHNCQHLAIEPAPEPPPVPGHDQAPLLVSYCGVCRTDAKMWREGHRDLALPRVPGHEFIGRDPDSGQVFVSWPGQSCASCRYCRSGRENLCEAMRIIGFHTDGGYSNRVIVPKAGLIPVASVGDEKLLVFGEPIGCVLNGLDQIQPRQDELMLIQGGGVVGMLAALAARRAGCAVTVVEQSAEKIARLSRFAAIHAIDLVKETTRADFDCAINCCDSPIAFAQMLSRVPKGGRITFFSGLKKRGELDTGLLNLIHYRELELYGSYGPRRKHMVEALRCIAEWQKILPFLIEQVIPPSQVEEAVMHVLSGEDLKYGIDFSTTTTSEGKEQSNKQPPQAKQAAPETLTPVLDELLSRIDAVDGTFEPSARRKMDLKTKPLGALGRIEDLGVRIAVMQHTLMPDVSRKRLFVFAGDHGVVDEGVSAFPAKVTVQMVENFLNGGAAINVFCRQYDIDLKVVDMGVNTIFAAHPLLIDKKVAHGTANFAVRPAMTREQALQALENGARAFLEQQAASPCDIVGLGEMGIGNTSSATAIICAATATDISQVIGRGTGVDDEGLKRKREILERALMLHRPNPDDGLELLTALGGFELAGIAGATLAAAASGCCVVLDGVISTAAGLIAYLLCPRVRGYLVAGHSSVEKAQQAALGRMGLGAVIDLDFRLGEGTGAAVAMNLVDLACRTMREMASFTEAGVDSGNI